MDPVFKYDNNARYLTKDFRGGYNANNFTLIDVNLSNKRSSVKIYLLNIYSLWMKFYSSHGDYKPELKKYLNMYRCQLNFAMFYATSALGISWNTLTIQICL